MNDDTKLTLNYYGYRIVESLTICAILLGINTVQFALILWRIW